MRSFHGVISLWLVSMLGAAPCRADEGTGLTQAELDQLEWQNTDPRQEGTGVLFLSGELALLDRQRMTGLRRQVGGGFNLGLVFGRKRWPVMFGLSGGVTFLDYTSTRGPDVSGGVFWDRQTTLSRSVTLAHAELLARFQPWWGWVRPYLEGCFGIARLSETSDWSEDGGDSLQSEELQHSVSYLAGASVGVDIPIFTFREGAVDVFQLVLSVGARRLYTGPMKWSRVALAEGDEEPRVSATRERMRIWQPFISLGLSGGTKPRPANAPFVEREPEPEEPEPEEEPVD